MNVIKCELQLFAVGTTCQGLRHFLSKHIKEEMGEIKWQSMYYRPKMGRARSRKLELKEYLCPLKRLNFLGMAQLTLPNHLSLYASGNAHLNSYLRWVFPVRSPYRVSGHLGFQLKPDCDNKDLFKPLSRSVKKVFCSFDHLAPTCWNNLKARL